jgi:protocatechuate 3,4-dioxygenase beta subunit
VSTRGALIAFIAIALIDGRLGWPQPPTPLTSRSEPGPATSAPAGLAGARTDAYGVISGNVIDAEGLALADRSVRLRDARYGRIVGTKVTDRAGLFEFRAVDPGIYVVELVGADGILLAASDLLTVSAGSSVTTVVQLPYKGSRLSALLGDRVPHVAAVLSAAAAAGVLATEITGEDISPQ